MFDAVRSIPSHGVETAYANVVRLRLGGRRFPGVREVLRGSAVADPPPQPFLTSFLDW